ncbi:hypothetical protein C0J52_04035 [Blattella germanica]|nr:hypothetical protein C0J52_04035 [Blattella germanica]
MRLIMIPLRLSILSMESFGSHISDLIMKLVFLAQDPSTKNFNAHYLQPICRYLEHALESYLPSGIADEVCNKLQTYILNTKALLDKCYYLCNNKWDEKFAKFVMEVIVELLYAIFPSQVTKFEFSMLKLNSHTPYLHVITENYLNRILSNLTKLKSITLINDYQRFIVTFDFKQMKELREFTFTGCNNEILKQLSSCQQKLVKINVKNSIFVTDDCVNTILSCKHLQYLDITNTQISEKGVTRLIKGLSDSVDGHSLKVFKSSLMEEQILTLSECFPNLVSLEVCLDKQYSLKPLNILKNLKSLSVSGDCQFSVLFDKVLQEIGKQLRDLILKHVKRIEWNCIVENCSRLEKLGLLYTSEEQIPDNIQLEFPSVRCCELNVDDITNIFYIQLVLSRLVNLRRLNLHFCKWFNFSDLCMCLSKMMSRLDVIEIAGNSLYFHGDYIVVLKDDGPTQITNKWNLINVMSDIINKHMV